LDGLGFGDAVLEFTGVDLEVLPRVGEGLSLFLGGLTSREKGWPGREAMLGVTLSLRRPRCTSSK